jgi:hypothetical protein
VWYGGVGDGGGSLSAPYAGSKEVNTGRGIKNGSKDNWVRQLFTNICIQ